MCKIFYWIVIINNVFCAWHTILNLLLNRKKWMFMLGSSLLLRYYRWTLYINFKCNVLMLCSPWFSKVICWISGACHSDGCVDHISLLGFLCKRTFNNCRANHLAPVVQKLDSAIYRINLYSVDNAIGFLNTYPLDSDLSGG